MQDYITFEIAEVRAQLFKRLEATETMRTYITHNMDDSEELCVKLESVENKLIAA
ncbi:hypothetical protein CK203_110257 [Vitis vinifera]|uniref:Uncharacterized protein n=1 Tax=Vitis vinifera TaxID=29760 RepID=A0A438CFJ1_VITVI|nr:hypothetical protein CK203_110257 [Vitis vinifera]